MEDLYNDPFNASQDLSIYSGLDEVVSSHQLKEELKEKYKNLVYHKTKFPTLNELIGGFLGGEVCVVSGITKHGKTLFCQTLTCHFSESQVPCLWFTYEVPVMQFLFQFGEDLPHFYMPKILKDKNLDWIYDRIKEAKAKFNIKVIFIDHLHFLADIMIKTHPSLEIGRVMRTLKRWAVDLEITIFIVAHTHKIKPDQELDTGDVRDSSFIEQEADNVFYIWRSKNKENEAILKITANRGRGVMNKKITLFKKGNYLVEKIDLQHLDELTSDEDDFGR